MNLLHQTPAGVVHRQQGHLGTFLPGLPRSAVVPRNAIGRPSVAASAWFSSLLQPKTAEVDAASVSRTSVGKAARPDAKAVLTRYYEAYNRQDFDTMEALLAPDVVWHDMGLYEEPFNGREEVMAFKRKISGAVPDFKFVIDDITQSDPYKVGIMWHVELTEGVTMPFSRGCSFCTLNDQGQILSARDLVEVPNKPGDNGITLLGALTPLLIKLGPAADAKNLKTLPTAAAAVWAFYAGYTAYIMFSTTAPGFPVLDQPPGVLEEVFNESLNFFYVNIALDQLGITPVPRVLCCCAPLPQCSLPPVSEALFNFVAAWGVLFLPVILTEKQSQKVSKPWAWWTGIMFLTNVFFIPFLALRAAPEPLPPATQPSSSSSSSSSSGVPAVTAASAAGSGEYPSWTKASAAVGLAVGVFSLWWAVGGRPEYGDMQARLDYFQNEFATNRVFFAFVVDSALYSVWQATLLGGVPSATPAQRFVPFFGLAAHLLQQPTSEEAQAKP